MPDNIPVDPGVSGTAQPVATDLIAGSHYQRIKAGWGADGTWVEPDDLNGSRLPVGGAQLGLINETAPVSDTANSGLNGRLQRIAQRLTSLIALLPTALGAGGGLKVDGSGTALPVSGTVGLSGTIPVSATQLPVSLGQKTMAASLPVVVGSDQSAVPVTGTFWQATQPVSGTVTSNAGTNTSTQAFTAATPVDAGDEATTDEAIAAAAANTRLIGYSARETTGTAPAVFNIRHGTSNAGSILVTVSLGISESARDWYGPDGIAAASGIWLERVTGQVQVTGYYKVVP